MFSHLIDKSKVVLYDKVITNYEAIRNMKKLKDINWNQVYYFYEVARKLSMKETSKILGVSTPTVSEQIKKLEKLLGVTLFIRYPRRIELTVEGKNLFNFAEEIFKTGARFLDAVSPVSIGGYPSRIGIQETICTKPAIDFLLKYTKIYSPYGSINTIREMSIEVLERRILSDDLDWGIALGPSNYRDLEYKLIGHSRIVFCCSKELYVKTKIKSELFSLLPLAKSSWDHKLNKMINDHLIKHNIVVEEFFETDHREFNINLIQRGLCLGAFGKEEIQNASWAKNIKTFDLDEVMYLPYYVIWPKAKKKMIGQVKLRELLQTIKVKPISGYLKPC
jgi:LysR family transcriptional activator of nhaA